MPAVAAGWLAMLCQRTSHNCPEMEICPCRPLMQTLPFKNGCALRVMLSKSYDCC